MKLLHYQANNFHIKLAFNLSGLLLVGLFSGGLYNHPQTSVQVCEQQGSALGVHTLWTDEQGAECVMYVCFVRFQSISCLWWAVLWSGAFSYHSRPFCSLSLAHPATPHPSPLFENSWYNNTGEKNLSKMAGNSTGITLATSSS